MEERAFDPPLEWSPERKEAFALYRDMGPERNLRGVCQKLDKSLTLIGGWSTQDDWVMRCALYDADCDRQKQEAMREERERIAKMHAQAIDSTIKVLMQAPLMLAQKIESGELNIDADNDPYTLVRATEAASKVLPSLVNASRLVHGFSTANVEVKTSDVERKTLAELDAYLLGYDDGAEDVAERTLPELPNAE
jgi:hypothetical protein